MEPGKSATGIKCVSANEMQFLGHFPSKHVMPGVLIVEALAQTGVVAKVDGKVAVVAELTFVIEG